MSAHIAFNNITIGDVKRIVRDSKVGVFGREHTRKELLKYLMNENEVGEGNQFLHNDDTLFVSVYDEIVGEDSSYKTVLAILLPTWWPEEDEDEDEPCAACHEGKRWEGYDCCKECIERCCDGSGCDGCQNEDDDKKSANSSTYGEGCRRICRKCGEECSCWNYNDDHEVICEDCEDDEEDDE